MGNTVFSKATKSSKAVEAASMFGLVAVFVFLEVSFGPFSSTAEYLAATVPAMKTYSMVLVGGGFIGLSVYSASRRVELRHEIKAREEVESSFELFQIADSVTGLPNRKGLECVLNQRIETSGTASITMLGIEICNFDTIMSVHGAETADRVLVAIAERLVMLSQDGDFMSRGDDATFYVVKSCGTADERRFRMDWITEAVADFASSGVQVDNLKLQVYVTFGVLSTDSHQDHAAGWNAEALLRRVDFALHRARARGHEAVEVFDEKMEQGLHERAMVEANLADAIEAGEVVPYFQPFINLETNQVTGFEVLARWQHPTKGLISPGVFIPIAEDIGVLRMLTLSILRQACMAARDWPSHITLAINISPTDLSNDAVMQDFVKILRETGISPSRLEIEITENAFVEESTAITDVITKLKNEGVSISIDDFGTGYSSLHHLRVLPFDKIKIDQSFIKDMASNEDSRKIVQTVIALGKSLGLPTTAEGIEVGDNRDVLQELGCTIGQGYLFAKPLPQSDVSGFLDNYQTQIEQTAQVA